MLLDLNEHLFQYYSQHLSQVNRSSILWFLKNSEALARNKEQKWFLKSCLDSDVFPNTIQYLHLPQCFNEKSMSNTTKRIKKYIMTSMVRHISTEIYKRTTDQRNKVSQFCDTDQDLIKVMTNTAFMNSSKFHREKFSQKLRFLLNKRNPSRQSESHLETTETADLTDIQNQVTDLTNSLTDEEKTVLSKGPKFAISTGINENVKMEMKANLCRLAYHIRWINVIYKSNQTNRETNNTHPTPGSAAQTITYPKSEYISFPAKDETLEVKLTTAQNKVLKLIDDLKDRPFGTNLTHKELSILNDLKKHNNVYLPSDKGGEFCVIKEDTYGKLGEDHLNDESVYEKTRSINPSTIEKKINNAWKSIGKKRNLPQRMIYSFRTTNSTIPQFYHLVKTHKNGPQIKIRPIVSCVQSPQSKIMWLMTKILTPLLQTVPAHLTSSSDLIHRIGNLSHSYNEFHYPFSLDVEALYTSVPPSEAVKYAIGQLQASDLSTYGLLPDDIEELLKCIISNFFFTYQGKMYRQKGGLPMGTSISGPLAILYMDMLEKKFLLTSPTLSIYARYVDDIFIITKSKEEADNIFHTINSIDHNINFTIEYPKDNKKLSLLDFTITIDHESADFEFYKKSAKKPLFVHHDSALPNQQKQNIISNEMTRITERCTKDSTKAAKLKQFDKLLQRNGYPENTTRKHNSTRKHKKEKQQKQQHETHYLQLPYISDELNSRIINIFKKEGITVRISHRSYSIRNFLQKSKVTPECKMNNCKINNPKLCNRKNTVYQIKCNKCHQAYIGSTIRTLHTRNKEHHTCKQSSVYQHLRQCQQHHTWSTTTTIISSHPDPINLRFMESLFIKQRKPTINSQEECRALDRLLI